MNALFETEFIVELTERGVFLMGQILEGEFKIGDYIHLNDKWREKIVGIEMGDGKDDQGEHKYWVVVQIKMLSNDKISEIKRMLLKENQFKISRNPN